MFGFRNRGESGAIIIGGRHVAATQQCVHCGKHEQIVQGSGKKRGWCSLCKGFLCGQKICMDNCVPFEARLEYTEAVFGNMQETIKKMLSRYPGIDKLRL